LDDAIDFLSNKVQKEKKALQKKGLRRSRSSSLARPPCILARTSSGSLIFETSTDAPLPKGTLYSSQGSTASANNESKKKPKRKSKSHSISSAKKKGKKKRKKKEKERSKKKIERSSFKQEEKEEKENEAKESEEEMEEAPPSISMEEKLNKEPLEGKKEEKRPTTFFSNMDALSTALIKTTISISPQFVVKNAIAEIEELIPILVNFEWVQADASHRENVEKGFEEEFKTLKHYMYNRTLQMILS